MSMHATHDSKRTATCPKRAYATPKLEEFGAVGKQTQSGGKTFLDGGATYTSIASPV